MSHGRMSRRKGAAFENKIARDVTAWTGTKFTRTPSSGGWAKTGDITPKDPKEMVAFPFNLEMKNNESWNLPLLFKYEGEKTLPSVFGKWWKQCNDDAKKSKKIPVVVFTRNNDPDFCIMRVSEFKKLGLHKRCSIYIRIGPYRIFLWKEVIQLPYKKVLRILGKVS